MWECVQPSITHHSFYTAPYSCNVALNRLVHVCAGSPAHKAGMRVGDILTAINGRPAASIESE